MNRYELADMIVSGTQNASSRLREMGDAIFDADVSPCMSNYRHPSYCRLTARTIRLRCEQIEAIAAELREHAGMLDALSYIEPGDGLVASPDGVDALVAPPEVPS